MFLGFGRKSRSLLGRRSVILDCANSLSPFSACSLDLTLCSQITDAIHAKGSYVVMQLWALGRAADPSQLTSEDPSYTYHSSSDIRLDDRPADSPAPVPLTIPQIQQFVQWYATAASNAVHKAGFDGVEIHGAHGYLIDQFTQDTCNKRTDAYGGSVEGRTRFGLEVVDAVVAAVGAEKVGIRLSPWSPWQGTFRSFFPIYRMGQVVGRN